MFRFLPNISSFVSVYKIRIKLNAIINLYLPHIADSESCRLPARTCLWSRALLNHRSWFVEAVFAREIIQDRNKMLLVFIVFWVALCFGYNVTFIELALTRTWNRNSLLLFKTILQILQHLQSVCNILLESKITQLGSSHCKRKQKWFLTIL